MSGIVERRHFQFKERPVFENVVGNVVGVRCHISKSGFGMPLPMRNPTDTQKFPEILPQDRVQGQFILAKTSLLHGKKAA